MAWYNFPQSVWYGVFHASPLQANAYITIADIETIDAVGEELLMFGHVYINGAPAAAKTLSSAGGKIHARTGDCTWASSGTVMRIGLQDASTSAGPPLQPDGTWDVYANWTQGVEALSDNSWTSFPMESGSKSITHGDLVCVVAEITAVAGSDRVRLQCFNAGRACFPGVNRFISSSWSSGVNAVPNVILEFDDGTLGWFFGAYYSGTASTANETFSNSTNPDERGLLFYAPFSMKIDGVRFPFEANAAAADATITLYSDPLGTPTVVQSWTILGEQDPQSGSQCNTYDLLIPAGGTKILSAGKPYALAIKADSTGSIILSSVVTLANAAYRAACPFGVTQTFVTRNDGSGAFSESTTKTHAGIALSIAGIESGIQPISELGV